MADWTGDLGAAVVDGQIRALRPDYVAVLIVASGLQPGPPSPVSERALQSAERTTAALLEGRDPQDLPSIQQWRSAFAAFGVKHRDARSSAEALLRRASSGLPRIDRLTDIYNAVSVRHQIPIGGEDLTSYIGPPRLTVALGDETFDTVADGAPAVVQVPAGEVIWRDDAGVTCRRWNWRQCVRTRLSEQSTQALFILDGLGDDAAPRAQSAAADLMALLAEDSPEARFTTRTL